MLQMNRINEENGLVSCDEKKVWKAKWAVIVLGERKLLLPRNESWKQPPFPRDAFLSILAGKYDQMKLKHLHEEKSSIKGSKQGQD